VNCKRTSINEINILYFFFLSGSWSDFRPAIRTASVLVVTVISSSSGSSNSNSNSCSNSNDKGCGEDCDLLERDGPSVGVCVGCGVSPSVDCWTRWRYRHQDRELLACRGGVTFQKAWILSNATVRTSNLTKVVVMMMITAVLIPVVLYSFTWWQYFRMTSYKVTKHHANWKKRINVKQWNRNLINIVIVILATDQLNAQILVF